MSAMPSKGDLLPAVFLTYQQDLMASVSQFAVTAVEKSRRTGFSWAAAAIAAIVAASSREAGGSDVLYMGYEKDMTREFIGYVAEWAKSIEPAAAAVEEFIWDDPDHTDRDIKAFRVKFASGYEVVALPSVPRALRGKQGLVILDEAAFIDDLAEVLKAALAHLIWGGKVLILSTHNGEQNPFNTLIQDIRSGKLPYNLLRCTFDDALAQGLYKRICMTTGKTWSPEAEIVWRAEIIKFYGAGADEELFCVPSEGNGIPIPRALIEKRMTSTGPVLRWRCDADFVHLPEEHRTAVCLAWCEENIRPYITALDPELASVFGEDFARSRDLTVMIPAQIQRDLTRYVPFMVELRNVPFDQQREILYYICDGLPRLRALKLDAGGNGSYLAEKAMQKYGETRVEMVQLSEPWYREHMPPMRAAFEDGTIALPKDADVLDDFAHLRLVRGVIRVPDRVLGSDGEGRHGDAAIAGALMYAASRADPELYEVRPASVFGEKKENQFPMRAEDWNDDDNQGAPGQGWMPDLRGGIIAGQGRTA
jgi:phage FluMu gp28-like protein